MPLDPIKIELTGYNKIQILRKQLEERTREFEEIESSIKEVLIYINEIEYLKSLSPAYAGLDGKEQIEQVKALEARRSELNDLVKHIENTLPLIEQEIKKSGGVAPVKSAAPRSIQRNTLGGAPKPAAPAAPAANPPPQAAPAQAAPPSPVAPAQAAPPPPATPEKKKLSINDFRKK